MRNFIAKFKSFSIWVQFKFIEILNDNRGSASLDVFMLPFQRGDDGEVFIKLGKKKIIVKSAHVADKPLEDKISNLIKNDIRE